MDGVQLPQDQNENHFEETVYFSPLRDYREKTFATLSEFWPLGRWDKGGGGGWGGVSESVKKGKFVTKIFFSDKC